MSRVKEGVEVITNEACNDQVHGTGRYTEKSVHFSSRLPAWIRAVIPRVFYFTEKAWNYFPYTVTGMTLEDIRAYESKMYAETNNKVLGSKNQLSSTALEGTSRVAVCCSIATLSQMTEGSSS